MIKLGVLYPHTEGAHFDMAYYTGTHQKLVRERLGTSCKGLMIERGLRPTPSWRICSSIRFLHCAMLARHAPELMADIPNFATIRPILQIGEVVVA